MRFWITNLILLVVLFAISCRSKPGDAASTQKNTDTLNNTGELYQSASTPFYLEHMPPESGTELLGWKCKNGDDSLWANPEFNDESWEVINHNQDIRFFIASHPDNISWFRLKFRIADPLRKERLAAYFNAYGAYELYLNGRLVKKSGLIHKDPYKVKAQINVFTVTPLDLSEDSVQVIAVRYAYQKGVPYLNELVGPNVIYCHIGKIESSVQTYLHFSRDSLWIMCGFLLGVYFILTILHSYFFIYYRRRKENLYYSIFCFLFFLQWLFIILWNSEADLGYRMWYLVIVNGLTIFPYLLYLLTIYSLFGYHKRKSFIFLSILSLLAFVACFYGQYRWINVLNNVFSIVYIIESLRVAWIINKQQRTKASIIIIRGLLFFLLIKVIAGVALSFYFNEYRELVGFIYLLSSLANVIMISIVVALQIGSTSRMLERKLAEVKELSEEKQDILNKQNSMLEEQVRLRTSELKMSLENLKSTQAQLIHSEKMASLGELTAGIAHEIQNPLNFVNNFSEVNKELLNELKTELKENNPQEASQLADDIISNEEKINFHGKRADSIVKSMLQHSSTGSGRKELIDINALADEYLRLAYHGLRAKDPSFQVKLETELDPGMEKIKVVPQEMGRVLLNLLNNALYAVDEKRKQGANNYDPVVKLSSGKKDGQIEIIVSDNGNGIPERIKEKIFQPFFTTRPTGQGTGLGLSLSYDIVKAHGGDIKVKSKEGEGSEFTVTIPNH